MTRVDLDAFEREWVFSSKAAPILRDLVAELRAAREVVKAARWIEQTGALPPSNEVGARRLSDLEQAVRAYDQVVAP